MGFKIFSSNQLTNDEKQLVDLVKNAPKSLNLINERTLSVSAREISISPGFKRDLEKAKKLVNG